MVTIHYICRGNVLRSMLAEAYTKSLRLPDVEVFSSGTVADEYRKYNDPLIPEYQAEATRNGVGQYAKREPDQLTQERVDRGTITVCVNQRVVDEAQRIVQLPEDTIVWTVGDLDEGAAGSLTTADIYQKVVRSVNQLVHDFELDKD